MMEQQTEAPTEVRKSQVVIQTNAKIEQIVVGPDSYNVFVGDLVADVTDDDLRELFSSCGEIHTVNVIRDTRHQCKGFAFVHFATVEAQHRALTADYNGKMVRGRPCRVKLSEYKNVLFIGNIPTDLSEEEVLDAIKRLCAPITTEIVVELKTGPPPQRKSRGFCFATFLKHPVADACKKILSVATISGRPLNVSWAENLNREVDPETMAKVTTLYVSNLSSSSGRDS